MKLKRLLAAVTAASIAASLSVTSFAAVSLTPVTEVTFDEGGASYTLQSGAQTAAGQDGNALMLDGTDDYAVIDDVSMINNISGDFSINVWCYPESDRTWMRVYDFGTGDGEYVFLSSSGGGGANIARFAMEHGNVEQSIDTSRTVDMNQWNMITVTREGSVTSIYLNGVFSNTTDTITYAMDEIADGATTQNYLGKSMFASDPYFDGMIDGFTVYDGVLTAAEIQELAGDAYTRELEEIRAEEEQEAQEEIARYNRILIETNFYDKATGTELYQLTDGVNAEAVTVVKNYTQTDSEVTVTDSAGGSSDTVTLSSGQEFEYKADVPAGTSEFSVTVNTDGTEYDAGTLYASEPVSFPEAVAPDSADTTEGAHDPSIFKDPVSGTYYAYSSHNLIFTSDDLINWEKHSVDASYDFSAYTKSVTLTGSTPPGTVSGVPSVVLNERTDEGSNVTVMAAEYDADGALVSFQAKEAALVKGDNTVTFDNAVTDENNELKIFLWDNEEKMIPQSMSYTKDGIANYTPLNTAGVPRSCTEFIESTIPNYGTVNGTYWAPDVIYVEGDEYPYWMYVSVSCGLGGQNSVIGLVKSDSPLFWIDGKVKDCGVVLATMRGHRTNAIDANIFTDPDGSRYFVWGSFWYGIYAAPLTEDGRVEGVDYSSNSALLASCKNIGSRLYSTPKGTAGPEGPWMIKNDDTGYTYLFTSYGWLGSNYNIRIARTDKTMGEVLSDSDPHKQFLDQEGRTVGTTHSEYDTDEFWGYKMYGSYRLGDGSMEVVKDSDGDWYVEREDGDDYLYLGNGHNSVLNDGNGNWYLVEHARKIQDAVAYLQVHKMLWTEDGWPVVSPMVYAGEDVQTIPETMLYGTWDLASVGHTLFADGANTATNSHRGSDLPILSAQVIVAPDGKLYGGIYDAIGTWEFDGEYTLTFNFTADGAEDEYRFYKAGDTMKLYVLTGYDKDMRRSTLVFTGVDQNHITQLGKKHDQSTAVTYAPPVETEPTTVEKSEGGNPVLGFDGEGNLMYAGDPAALVDGDTVYIYAGHDTSTGDNYVMPEYVCYSSKDMTNWTYEGVVMNATDVSWRNDDTSAWASQVVKYGDKYYLYHCTWAKTAGGYQCIGVAVSESPTGPFEDIGRPLINGETDTTENSSKWNDIDPTVWVETVDGVEKRYISWGNSELYVAELGEDMTSIVPGTIKHQTIKNAPGAFTEAPWIYRRTDDNGNYTGPYYLFYAMGWREQMAYATTDDLSSGEWEYGGLLMPPTATSNTNHPSVIDFNGKTYFIYHNGSLPYGSGYRRSVCVTELVFNDDGSIQPVMETSLGLSGTASNIKTASGNFIIHENFTNPSGDGDYPLEKAVSSAKTTADAYDAQWEIVSGLSDKTNENYVSIQSVNKPGLYLKADNGSIVLAQDFDGNQASKMTFKTVKALDGSEGVSFESVSSPGKFITVLAAGNLMLTDGSSAEACSFTIEPATMDMPEPDPVTLPDPVSSYDFEDNLTDSVSGESGKAVVQTEDKQLIDTDTAVVYGEGADGKAVTFSGAGSYGISLPTAPDSSVYSISFDAKLNASTQYTPFLLLVSHDASGNPLIGDEDAKWISIAPQAWQETLASGPMIWSRNVGVQDWYDLYTANNNSMSLNEWHNITVTVSGSSGRIYVDGALVASGSVANIVDSTTAAFLGINYWDTPLNGSVDNLRFYNVTLSAEQVALIAQ